MSKKKEFDLHEFTVEGTGGFPFDMLRYDQAWPKYETEALTLADGYGLPRRVVLQSRRNYAPTERRWRSFGWVVVGRGDLREEI